MEIYQNSRIYVATPSRWLMKKVEESMLAPAIKDAKVIPNGVDLSVFHPTNQKAVRASLGLPHNAKILLFTANGILTNIWKDYWTLRTAISRVAAPADGQRLLLVALGEGGPAERVGNADIVFVPYQTPPDAVARYYQAADIYIHAARADTFPNTVLEALACGIPVIATAVGGIPEQVKGLKTEDSSLNQYQLDKATGFLTSPGDAEELRMRLEQLLGDELLRVQISSNAASDARQRFSLEQQVEAYLDWYQEILRSFDKEKSHR
jgi:glycosyltransferase involved in cell wall biosynthesis